MAALGAVQFGEVVEASGHIRVLRPERRFQDRQGAFVEGLGVRIQPDGDVALTFESPRSNWPKLLVFLDKKEREGEEES